MTKPSPKPLEAKVHIGHPFYDIIEEAYRVFACPKPRSIEVCERCCMDARIESDFLNPPIRELPLSYIRDWYYAAYDPKGIAKDTWVYLLPRILEILASDEDVSNMGIELSLNRFDTGNPENWTSEQWQILDRFQKAYLQHRVDTGLEFLDDVICMFTNAGWPLDGLLKQVSSIESQRLALRLWNDWCRWTASGSESIWISAFWKSPSDATVLQFYTSKQLYDNMEELALSDEINFELTAKASAVAGVIEASANWSQTAS